MTDGLKWTWMTKPDGKCWDQAFDTAEEALKEMATRQGREVSLTRLADAGIHLVLARVTVEPVFVMSSGSL